MQTWRGEGEEEAWVEEEVAGLPSAGVGEAQKGDQEEAVGQEVGDLAGDLGVGPGAGLRAVDPVVDPVVDLAVGPGVGQEVGRGEEDRTVGLGAGQAEDQEVDPRVDLAVGLEVGEERAATEVLVAFLMEEEKSV